LKKIADGLKIKLDELYHEAPNPQPTELITFYNQPTDNESERDILTLDCSLLRGLQSRDLLAYEVLDDAMSQTISLGDTVIFNTKSKNPAIDGIYLFAHRHGNSLGRIIFSTFIGVSKIRLDNPLHATEINFDPKEHTLLGKIVLVIKRFD